MDTNNSQNPSKNFGILKDKMSEVESKTQKIVTALYLVSDLIDEEDPLRKDMRNLSVALSALVGSISIESPSQAKKTITEAQNYIDRLVNVLKVCVSVGFVSDMNFKIVSEYLIFVRDDLNQKYALINSQSLIASSFHNKAIHEFVLPESITQDVSLVRPREKVFVQKDKVEMIKKDIIKDTDKAPQKDFQKGQDSNNQRMETILSIIGTKGEVSAGDVSSEFPELSEKTIQRMLIRLVETGKLSKTGEKRWSRYSIAP